MFKNNFDKRRVHEIKHPLFCSKTIRGKDRRELSGIFQGGFCFLFENSKENNQVEMAKLALNNETQVSICYQNYTRVHKRKFNFSQLNWSKEYPVS